MDLENLVEKSSTSQGALGAIVFAVAEALNTAGATELEVKHFRSLCEKHFGKLSTEHCNLISAMVEKRLQLDKNSDGNFY